MGGVAAAWAAARSGAKVCLLEETFCYRFKYLLDATELGDLLPLKGTEHIIGAETKALIPDKKLLMHNGTRRSPVDS